MAIFTIPRATQLARVAATALALAAVAGTAQAETGFTGSYAPGQWTTLLTGSPGGGGAPAGASNDGSTLTLTGGDGACGSGPCQLLYGINVPAAGQTLSFHWSYATTDPDGPAFESFGIVVAGQYTQLSDPAGAATQSGDYSVPAALGAQFAWYLDCADCIFGNTTVAVTNFQAVPEPPVLALSLLGGAVLVAAARRRRAA